jgi:hypothetical protein
MAARLLHMRSFVFVSSTPARHRSLVDIAMPLRRRRQAHPSVHVDSPSRLRFPRMAQPPVQGTPDGMAVLAARCQALADGFAVSPPAGVASNWQASAAAVNRANDRAGQAITASATRMRATGADLTTAHTAYAANESDAVHRFSQLPPRGPVLA